MLELGDVKCDFEDDTEDDVDIVKLAKLVVVYLRVDIVVGTGVAELK